MTDCCHVTKDLYHIWHQMYLEGNGWGEYPIQRGTDISTLFAVAHCSVTKSCPTLCNPMNCITPGFPISQSLLELMSIESVMPSNHLILCHPLLLLPSVFLRIRDKLKCMPSQRLGFRNESPSSLLPFGLMYPFLEIHKNVYFLAIIA